MPQTAPLPALPAGFCTRPGRDGPVLACAQDPGPFFSADPMRALQLVRLAAVSGCAADWDSFSAALEAAPALVRADPRALRDELNLALTGPCPQALAPLVQAGALKGLGIAPRCACLHPLAQAPDSLLGRWWLFLRLCEADAAQALRRTQPGQSFCRDFERLENLFQAGAPADRPALKRALTGGAPLPVGEMAALFALADPAWARVEPLYQELLVSGEPFLPDQLAVTAAGLIGEGVPARKADRVLAVLLQLVVEQPQLNSWPVLAQLGRSLARYL